MSKVINKKLHPYYKTGIYGWLGEEVDDNDYIICPICGEVLGMNYYDYQAENDGDNKCPKCEQELDYSEIYDFEDTLYFRQLLEIKESRLADLETKLAEKDRQLKVMRELKNRYLNYYKTCETECSQLKQQLAEKEKLLEINERILRGTKLVRQELEQEKISFAVEKLEEVKYYAQHIQGGLINYIENQIKAIKGEK